MAKISKGTFRWILVAVAVVVAAAIAFGIWRSNKSKLPGGIVSGNGRIEGTLVDIAAREPLRVKQIFANEGDLVKPGQVLVQMDTSTLESQLAEAKANLSAAQEQLALSQSAIAKQESEVNLAQVELNRSQNLVREGAGSQRELDVRRNRLKTAQATLAQAQAALKTSTQKVEVARANVQTVQTRIDDATLRSPVTGRVLYRLAEPGEVLAPGGKALTLVNLQDLYMEIFVPSKEASAIQIGADARITVDYDPVHAVAAKVSFVSPEAQFTPKQVETASEREKLMFRVKIQLPRNIPPEYLQRIKTGVRGMGYVKIDPDAKWPPRLQNLVGPQQRAADQH